MIVSRIFKARILRAARLIISVAVFAAPRLCLAQDNRTDDPPDPPRTAQTIGTSGTSGTTGPSGATGTTGTTGTSGAAQPIGATSPTPVGGMFTEPRLITKSIRFAVDKFEGRDQKKDGWYPEFSNMITGAGWISVGPGYRHYMWDKEAFFDASAAASWHLYTMAQTRFEAPDVTKHHISLGTQVMWQDQTQINYFGIGPDSLEADKSQYQLKSTDAVGYASIRPATSWTIGAEAGYLFSPKVSSPSGTFKPNLPTTIEEFPLDPAVDLPSQPAYIHGEAAITGDTRDYRGHPTRGGLYRLVATMYADQDTGVFSFRQYQAEAAQLIRLGGPNWILALHGWVVASEVSGGDEVPFYFLPSLGGATSLRSFSNYRFHDQNSALVNVESRWAVFTHVDFAVFADAGNVAPVFRDLNLDHTSVGAGLRLHAERTTFARLDAGYGSEGWHVFFRTSDLFRFSRITRRVAGIPFVP
jgi:hypothetical protein